MMVGDTAMTMYDFSFDLLVYYWLKGVAFSIEKVEQIITMNNLWINLRLM